MDNCFKRLTNPLINLWGRKKIEKNFLREPIIIGGSARSGTTLLISILSVHPEIYTFPTEVQAFLEWHIDKHGNADPARIDRLHRNILFTSIPEKVTRWCEKSPRNVRHFGRILEHFNEEVKLIHIVRDGRDVITSRHPEDPDAFWVTPDRWATDVTAGLEYEAHPQVHTVYYEDIVNDYEDTVAELFEFLGENYHEKLREYHKHAEIKKANSWFHPVKAVHSNSIGRWQKAEFQDRYEKASGNDEFMQALKNAGYLSKDYQVA